MIFIGYDFIMTPGRIEDVKGIFRKKSPGTTLYFEIVQKYDVDGIHIDDYFYPGSDFPDGEAFAEYGGGFENIGDWRRNNTKELVKALQKAVCILQTLLT